MYTNTFVIQTYREVKADDDKKHRSDTCYHHNINRLEESAPLPKFIGEVLANGRLLNRKHPSTYTTATHPYLLWHILVKTYILKRPAG